VSTYGLVPEVATLGLAIGLLFSLMCYLTTNLSPGGMITPGWVALTLVEDYRRAAIGVFMPARTFGATTVLQRAVLLYGKRLFAAQVFGGDDLFELDPTGKTPPRKIRAEMGGCHSFAGG